MLFPSCWSKDKSITSIPLIKKQICWRFCGGFYIGDKHSIIEMHFLIQKELPNFINYNTIVWEVNLWAWLEYNCNWLVDTYDADHNDSILHIPDKYNINTDKFDITKYIDKVIYINLEHRLDRKQEIEGELNTFNIPYERFNAISVKNHGILGCNKSHLEVLRLAKHNNYKNILIFEDDFKFIVSKEEFEKNISLLFEHNVDFDICMLSYNLTKSDNIDSNIIYSSFLTKVINVHTTSGYIVNEKMYDRLINLYEYANPLLEQTREHWKYALDQIWNDLNPTSKWYSFTQRIGIQRPSFSDNSNQWCDLQGL